MKFSIIILSFFVGMLLAACGQLPTELVKPNGEENPTLSPTPTPTPSPTPTPDPDAGLTTIRFTNYYSQNQLCDALRAWNQNTTVIVFPELPGRALNDLVYKRGKVYLVLKGNNPTASDIYLGTSQLTYNGNSPGCLVKINFRTGDFIGVENR